MLTRIYQPVSLNVNDEIRLDERGSHHLARVLRARVNDDITLFNGEGGEYRAIITRVDKKFVAVLIKEFVARDVEMPFAITLLQGLIRNEKMDWLVQKAVELGVAVIQPVISSRTNLRFDAASEAKRIAHWQAVAMGACEQSGRNRVPALLSSVSYADAVLHDADYRFILDPTASASWPDVAIEKGAKIALLIGPEGGFSDDEVAIATKGGFTRVALGPRILRAETASLAAIASFSAVFGGF